MVKQILLCAPDYFQIEYEINPWMHVENKVNADTAKLQFSSLKSTYESLNIPTGTMIPQAGLPDMVYTANYGFVKGNLFVGANFRYPERRKETDFAEEYFAAQGYETVRLPESIFYEGEGDHLFVNGVHFMGYGKRTDKEAAAELAAIFNEPVVPLELVNPFFYHLDTALGPLSKDTAIVNKESFTKKGLNTLQEYFSDILFTNEEDNKVMAPNLLCWENQVIMAAGISDSLRSEVEERGYDVHQLEMSEFLKGGGSIKCLSLQLHE